LSHHLHAGLILEDKIETDQRREAPRGGVVPNFEDLRVLDILPNDLIQVDSEATGPHEGRQSEKLHGVTLSKQNQATSAPAGDGTALEATHLRNTCATDARRVQIHDSTEKPGDCTAQEYKGMSSQPRCTYVRGRSPARPRSERLSMNSRRRPHFRESRNSTKLLMINSAPKMERMLEICEQEQSATVQGSARAALDAPG
jgi:hypothetical protein